MMLNGIHRYESLLVNMPDTLNISHIRGILPQNHIVTFTFKQLFSFSNGGSNANLARTRTMDWEGVVKANCEPDVDRIDSLDIGLVFPDGTTNYVRDAASEAAMDTRSRRSRCSGIEV
jgi:hypothetical protein